MLESNENNLSKETKNIKNDQMGILELKNTITKIKTYWMNSTTEWRGHSEELVKLKREQYSLSNQSKREKIG